MNRYGLFLAYDEDKHRIYQLKVRDGDTLTTAEGTRFQLPIPVRDLYHFQYKFNPISNAETIYPPSVRNLRDVHAGFLYWEINILDDSPDKYLNIDRDRLREGAVLEEELAQVREIILQHWCKYLIDWHHNAIKSQQKQKEKALAKIKHENGNIEKFIPQKPKNIYQHMPLTLVSLALLFYQNVPTKQFREFIEPYTEFLKEQKYMLMGENVYVDRLWEENALFQSCFSLPKEWIEAFQNIDSTDHPDECTTLHIETILRLPHRLIHIETISFNNSKELSYNLKFGHPSSKPQIITMDKVARLHDYCGAIEPDPSRGQEVNIDSLVRKVFKPNKKYSNLLVSKYPKTFKRGGNFASPLDHCIRWYILSPFDRDLTSWLTGYMCKKSTSTKTITSEINNKIDNYVTHSEQMKKCMQYVYKQYVIRAKTSGQALSEDIENIIQKEYTEFLIDCCQLFIEYKDLIKNKFKNNPIIS